MSDAVIACEELTIGPIAAAQTEVVRAISFTLQRGEVLGLIGESGAGKTTLGLAALGHLRDGLARRSGRMRFCGRDLFALTAEELRAIRGTDIAYVAQSAAASFNPALTLLRQICEPVRRKGCSQAEAEAKAAPLLAALGLPGPDVLRHRYASEMSGGQLQRAMIAMALLPGPQVVVFDEPTTALDDDTQAEVLAAIRTAIALTKISALYISHDLELVTGLADRVMILRHGAVVEEASAAQLRTTGATSSYAQALLAAHDLTAAERPTAAPVVLQVSDLTLAHPGGAVLVQGLEFAIARGETLALTGPSGSGKSSVMRAITGLMAPLTGHITLSGSQLAARAAARSRSELAAVQIVHQLPDLALNPAHSIGFILSRGLRLAGQTAEPARLAALMRDVELDPALLTRRPPALSGGQKQRVCIARALAADPQLLICDEPTASLDPLVAKGVVATLARLQQMRGTACLLISHDRRLVEQFAHREISLQDFKPRAARALA